MQTAAATLMSVRDDGRYQTARRLFSEKKFAAAFAVYEELAKLGDPQCQVFLGWMYSEGLGALQDRQEALAWFRRAASLGSKEGAFYCGKSALASRNYSEALDWFRKAAVQEYGPALLWLGLAHVRGLGVDVDQRKGVAFLERASSTGNFPARRELAVLMIKGHLGIVRIPEGIVRFVYAVCAAIVSGIFRRSTDELIG